MLKRVNGMITSNDIRKYAEQAREVVNLQGMIRKHNSGTYHDYVDGYLDGCRDSYNAILEYLDAITGGDDSDV